MGSRSIKLTQRGEIEIAFPYSREIVDIVRALPQRRWEVDRKVWTLPATRIHAAATLRFADAYDFEIDEHTRALAAQAGGVDFTFTQSPSAQRTLIVEKDRIVIAFPFDANMVEQIKLVAGSRWDKDARAWTLPITADSLKDLCEFADTNEFSGDLDRLKELAEKNHALVTESIEASRAASADFDVHGLGGTLRPFQRAGVKYAVEKKRVIIGEEMGLGKTIEALAVLQAAQAFPSLIICPASLKLNWYREAQAWLPGKAIQILGGDPGGRADAAITIINYDRLKQYRDYLVRREFKAVVCDESHFLKSGKAARTIYVEEIVNGVIYERSESGKPNRRKKEQLRPAVDVRLLLSGTPLLNRPEELVSQLQILDRLKEFGGWHGFMRDFCGMRETRWGMDTSGAANLKKLHDLLRSRCYVRRTKAEVLKELPAKQRTIIPVEISNRKEYDRAEADLISWLQDTAGAAKADAAERAEQLVRIEALKQLAARGKMTAIKEWVEDFLDTGEKLVAFAWHKAIVGDLANEFHCHQITGDTPLNRRQEYVDAFQNDPRTNILACNVQAGGVGLTLTAASNVAFCELGWNPAQHSQAEDRVHRIGQTDSVMAWYFIGRKTIDEDIQGLIEAKRAVVNAATDGTEKIEDVSVMNALVARLRGDEKRDRPEREYTPGNGGAELELF